MNMLANEANSNTSLSSHLTVQTSQLSFYSWDVLLLNDLFKQKNEAGTKVLASQLFFDCRARRSG